MKNVTGHGWLMIPSIRIFLPVLPTIAQAVDHIDHVVKVAGIDHVGIGSDFDGGGGLADCVDVADYPKITAELLKRGYSEKDIDKIWGGNFLRVFRAVEKEAAVISRGSRIISQIKIPAKPRRRKIRIL